MRVLQDLFRHRAQDPVGVRVSKLAEVSDTAQFKEGCVVWHFSTVCEDAQFGVRCVIGSCVYVGREVRAGHDVRIQHGAFLPNGTQIGDRVFIGPNVTLTDDKRPRVNNLLYRAQPPILEDEVSLGAGVIILPGIRIGRGALIGAGTVVTKDVPPGAIVHGETERHPEGRRTQ